METRQLGKTDMQVGVLGFGADEIQGLSLPEVERVIGSALDAGANVIDTTEHGDSEDLIGRGMAFRRGDFYLFTKCGHNTGDELPNLPDWDPRLIEASIDRSLRRLRTDHLDLVQLDNCPLDVVRRGDVVKALQKAKREGKTRYIGYCGDNEDARYAIKTGFFDTLQVSLNIADQQEIDLTLPAAVERGMGIIAKRPIANAAWKHESLPRTDYAYPYWERLQILQYDFLKQDAFVALSTALRFTLSVPDVAVAIVGARNADDWRDNLEALSQAPMLPEQYESIRAIWEERSDPHWLGQA